MANNKEELLKQLADAVVDMDEEKAVELSQIIVAEGIDAYEAIEKGLSAGMEVAGRLFEEEEYFIPELLMCSDAMYAGLSVLKPHLKAKEGAAEEKVKIVIGVIEGDTHDIGKNLVKILLETSGYEIIDLGRDISPQKFIDTAKEQDAKIIAISTLMTTTMDGLAEVIRLLQQQDIREQFKVMIGGAPVSQAFADKIGADSYAVNAATAVRLARQLTGGAA
ncbi:MULTISPECIES: corrinoid protein [Pelosinus]|uniref:Cobalamin B12-binding domain protein n=1 Tax=Pelosinus fermentans B4 TaxID=1149862 RepID=I9B3S5_9FIRM|nr:MULTISPECIES: corrinoid protein [Pelosinus]EIW19792.1 cobalamin B12-binding domain protein [Pelosinus fermentans B4]EIW21351.1 Methionine synthase B12-binding module cap domain protein [Pelosinus fermentans A11]OAM94946.1 cobalamin B12-binding domain protein [Pelosinus fermentans DSM 17108]SDR20875.1 methylmalonyl-CoA mutase C-terminal domain-containing protein/methyltransferase cognate corrinoid proteins [Pelosinus fermentans]